MRWRRVCTSDVDKGQFLNVDSGLFGHDFEGRGYGNTFVSPSDVAAERDTATNRDRGLTEEQTA